MIRIEILNITDGIVNLALYYPVPGGLYNPASNDQTRTPAGTRLSASELQDLKDGKLYEYLASIPVSSRKLPQLRGEIQRLWADKIPYAKAKYKQDFSYTGRAWDGVNWS